jgi:hypothetical protein
MKKDVLILLGAAILAGVLPSVVLGLALYFLFS